MSARRDLPEHLPVADVAARLGVCQRTVRRWIRAGEMSPAYRLGRRLTVVPIYVVSRFLESRRVA